MAEVVLSGPAIDETETQVQSDENYKLYKRRWLVLTAMFSISLVVGLHRCIISIADLLENHLQITEEQYDYVGQASVFVMMFSVLPVAFALEYFGLRRMFIYYLIKAYFACSVLVCANGLKILCCNETFFKAPIIRNHRYIYLLLSEAFLGVANSVALCVPPKVASAWFANYENTLALVIAYCGYNIGVSSSNYFTPIFIKAPEDVEKLCYMFVISAIFVTFIVLTCITRSSPKIAPSSNALISANLSVPFLEGLEVMIKQPHFILLLITLTLNLSTMNSEQFMLEVILKIRGYSNSFCGALIAHAFFFGTFFMLIGAAWLDSSSDYLRVSKIASLLCVINLVAFNISLCIPNIENVIIATNLLASFGSSLMYPSLLQVAIRSAIGILPEASVSAVVIITQQIITMILLNLFTVLRKITRWTDYTVPLLTFSLLAVILNVLYISLFKLPKKEDLIRQLRSNDTDMLVEEE